MKWLTENSKLYRKKRDTKQKERKGMVDGSKELENVVQQSESK